MELHRGAQMGNITVGIYDDHEIFAYGVRSILRSDPMIGGVSLDLDDAPDLDVAVTSVGYIDRPELTCPIVVCASPADVPPAPLTESGVAALLNREDISPEQLRSAVHAAAAGLRIQWETAGAEVLDERGRAVLRLIADGAGTREISQQLGYSERTIKGTIQQVEQVLGARSRAHAVAVAVRAAII